MSADQRANQNYNLFTKVAPKIDTKTTSSNLEDQQMKKANDLYLQRSLFGTG